MSNILLFYLFSERQTDLLQFQKSIFVSHFNIHISLKSKLIDFFLLFDRVSVVSTGIGELGKLHPLIQHSYFDLCYGHIFNFNQSPL